LSGSTAATQQISASQQKTKRQTSKPHGDNAVSSRFGILSRFGNSCHCSPQSLLRRHTAKLSRQVCMNGGKCMDGFWDFGLVDSQFSEIDIFAAVS
jgi:hypothetical protein